LPHEHLRNGTAKLLLLFEPSSGQARVQGVSSTANAVLHPWMKQQLRAILADLPTAPPLKDPAANRRLWQRWQEGLRWPLGLPDKLPALRLLLVLDNLAQPPFAGVRLLDVCPRHHAALHALLVARG
jgi:hypothetical protein